jgi:hypothetical protein
MRKAGAFFLLLLMAFFTPLLNAQEEEPGDFDPDMGEIYMPEQYTRGDQIFSITLGFVFPVAFFNNGEKIDHNFEPPIGGIGALGYNFFLTPNIFVGAEISGMFLSTLGQNTAFFIPIGARVGYQFIVWRFEIPLSLTAGVAWHRYLNQGYFGMYLKAGGAVFYRFNADWSFGINANWCWLPEWTNEPEKNVDGHIAEVTLSVRYHF